MSDKEQHFNFKDLLDIMAKLRGEGGCPWDREQTHESLRQYMLEESYEVVDAINHKDDDELKEELGDVLLQVVFHAQIAAEQNRFTIQDVIDNICRKMISRHTHIFGDDTADTVAQVLDNWERIKSDEKGFDTHTERMKAIPSILPALMRSYKVQKKAAAVGFDWDDVKDAISKVDEELQEFKDVYLSENYGKIVEELGDLLFAIVNVARFLDIQPELALNEATEKFIKRFEYIENSAKGAGKRLEDMSLKEMDELWEQAKL